MRINLSDSTSTAYSWPTSSINISWCALTFVAQYNFLHNKFRCTVLYGGSTGTCVNTVVDSIDYPQAYGSLNYGLMILGIQ